MLIKIGNSFPNQYPHVFWFTGFSGAGKSTLANAFEKKLSSIGWFSYVVDGDDIRSGLCKDLTFSPEDRKENIRRIGELCQLLLDIGIICLVAVISPTHNCREQVRCRIGKERFSEIYVRCPLAICESRDPKGNYRKARSGIIKNYTGISSDYEEPQRPDLIVDTSVTSVEESVLKIFDYAVSKLGGHE